MHNPDSNLADICKLLQKFTKVIWAMVKFYSSNLCATSSTKLSTMLH